MEKHVITLEYCVPCSYWSRAAQVVDDVMSNYPHVIESFELITGTKGVFDVVVDGQTLFSKKEIGRHAEPGEVLTLFQELIGPDVEPFPKEL